jgi:signal transduction histidine kinase
MNELATVSQALVGLLVVAAIMLMAMIYAVSRLRGSNKKRAARENAGEVAMLSIALQEAVGKLKAQERAMAERAEASEQLSAQIIEGLTSGLVVVSKAGTVQAMNPAARRILHLADGAGNGPFRQVLAGAPALAKIIGEALESAQPIVRRTVQLGETHLGVTVSPIRDRSGAMETVVCLFTDLTSVMELEEQLRLKDSLARLGELTAGLAHEFRNGLATIHGYGRLLDPAALPAAQRPIVEGIRSETTALGAVVTNFLRFAKPDPLTLAPVDLRHAIESAVEDVQPPASAVTIAGTFETIDGDDVLLRQAFANLIRNSLDACSEAGIAPRITVTGEVEGQEQRVTVEDNGSGLSADAQKRLFQPFATTKSTGTRLGLAIVQKVLVSHNGRITAGNRPEGGAQFRIRLPRRA